VLQENSSQLLKKFFQERRNGTLVR